MANYVLEGIKHIKYTKKDGTPVNGYEYYLSVELPLFDKDGNATDHEGKECTSIYCREKQPVQVGDSVRAVYGGPVQKPYIVGIEAV